MSNTRVALFVTFKAKQGRQHDLKAALAEQAAASRNDAGCQILDLLQSVDDDHTFMFSEVWESEAALDAHRVLPYLAAYRERRTPLLAAEPTRTKWTVVD